MENAAKRKAKRKLKHTKAKQYRKFMAASASVTEASEPKSFEAERRRRRNRNTENRNTKINNKSHPPIAPSKFSRESASAGGQRKGKTASGELASQTQTFAINRSQRHSNCNCNLLGAISTAGRNLNLMLNSHARLPFCLIMRQPSQRQGYCAKFPKNPFKGIFKRNS